MTSSVQELSTNLNKVPLTWTFLPTSAFTIKNPKLNRRLSRHEILNEGPSPGTVQLRECLLTALLYTARCYGDLKGVTCGDKSVLIVRQKGQCHDLWWQGYFHSVTPPIDGNPPRNLRPRNNSAGSNFKLFWVSLTRRNMTWTLLSNCSSHQFLSYKL